MVASYVLLRHPANNSDKGMQIRFPSFGISWTDFHFFDSMTSDDILFDDEVPSTYTASPNVA